VRIYVGVIAAVLALGAIGCGSGGGGATEAALTKAQFIKRGDAICKREQEQKEEALARWRQGNKGKTLADFTLRELEGVYSTLILPHVKDASDRLAELKPPAGDEEAEKMVQSLNNAVDAVGKNPQLAIKGAPYAQADGLAQAYGFKACGLF
jgi:hypothetical protein